jgi:hypothetical protein
MSGFTQRFSASSNASTQKLVSRVLDNLQDNTAREYQSMTATGQVSIIV